jgi:hypothetical protein
MKTSDGAAQPRLTSGGRAVSSESIVLRAEPLELQRRFEGSSINTKAATLGKVSRPLDVLLS